MNAETARVLIDFLDRVPLKGHHERMLMNKATAELLVIVRKEEDDNKDK